MRLAWRLFACSTILITGCSVTSIATKTPAPAPDPSGALTGMVHGGPPQAPIKSAKVYMYGVAIGSPGTASRSAMLQTSNTQNDGTGLPYYVKTLSTGRFSIGINDYNCGIGGVPEQVYLYSVEGDAGTGTNNTAAGLMAVLGTCTSKVFSPTIPTGGVQMDEVTTVAAAYTLAPFGADPTHLSMSGSSQAKSGLANAITMAGLLASITSGTALAPGADGTAVQQQINSLANSLAACVNTTGPSSTGCTEVLDGASDTAGAAITIARTGGGSSANVAQIYTAATAYPQFTPHLTGATPPNDWTLAITYFGPNAGTQLASAQDVAIDSSGNVYVSEAPSSGTSQLDKLTPFGAVATHSPFTGNGLNQPYGLAIDGSDNIWAVDYGNNEISGFSPTGTALTNSPLTGNGLSAPLFSIAVDSFGNLWVPNFGNHSLSGFSPSGTYTNYNSGGGYGGLNGPDGICLENGAHSDIWVTNPDGVSGTSISRFSNSTTTSPATISASTYYASGITYASMVGPISCAIDATGHVWTSNYGGASSSSAGVSRFSANNSVGDPPVTFTGGGVNGTYGGAYFIAIDGAGHVWTANYGPSEVSHTGSITELDNSGNPISGSNGFQPGLNKPDSIAIDASGNVWVVDNGDGALTELVGAATPVVTPLSTAATNSKLGSPP